MNLYDPSLAVQTYGQGLQQANADQMALAQAPTPAQVFLDRLRQSKQDQLQRDQFDWQKQYQTGMLQNTAERNAAWAENNKLKNALKIRDQDIKTQLGQAAQAAKDRLVQLRATRQEALLPGEKAKREAEANFLEQKIEGLAQLYARPANADGTYDDSMFEESHRILNDLRGAQAWRALNYLPEYQSSGFGGGNIPVKVLPYVQKHADELQRQNEANAKAWDKANQLKTTLAQAQGQPAPQNPYRTGNINYMQLAAQDFGYGGVEAQDKSFNVEKPTAAQVPPRGHAAKRSAQPINAQPNAGPDGVVSIKDDSEYNALKPGTKYKGPDGVVRIK